MVHLSHAALATAVAPPATIAPISEHGFILQMLAAGGAIGSAFALRMPRRNPDADTWMINTVWALLGLGVGALVVVAAAI